VRRDAIRSAVDDSLRALNDYDQMADLYADDADVDPIKTSYDRPAIVAMAGDVRGKRVLELGCAAGGLTELLLERGATVVGLDLNPRLIERAREHIGERAELVVADITQPLPFDDASFDVVTASLVLHYLADWRAPMLEVARVLRPGSRFVMSTHHPTHDLELATEPASYFDTVLLGDTWRKGGREFQVRFYHRPLSAIVDALAEAGFVIERIPEPVPDRAAFAAKPAFYDRMIQGPWFLFVQALKPDAAVAGERDGDGGSRLTPDLPT
jgi:SAM-dependent methyltransferase